jgi:uncharacterized protein with GYD domain
MPKYLIQVSYVGEGLTGLLEDGGSGRVKASAKIIEALGGRLEAMYFAFGETDAFIIVDLPDNASAVTCSLVVNASGRVKITYTPLITHEEVDQAAEKGKQLSAAYRAPGQ